MSSSRQPVLDYFHESPEEFDDRHGDLPAALSLACPIVPIAGLILSNGPLVMAGFSLVAWLGILLGLFGCISGCRSEALRIVARIGLILNLLFGGFAVWAIMVHGIC